MRSANTEHATEETHTKTDKRNDAEQQEQRITGDSFADISSPAHGSRENGCHISNNGRDRNSSLLKSFPLSFGFWINYCHNYLDDKDKADQTENIKDRLRAKEIGNSAEKPETERLHLSHGAPPPTCGRTSTARE